MSGVTQAIFMNQRSFGLKIGDAYQGGFYAGQISTSANGIATHNLIISPISSGQTTNQWKNDMTATAGATSSINGEQNTADMVADGNSTVYPCAHFCNDLSIGGFSDWYMPAKNELDVCYFNLKPTTTSNNTSSGTNSNAVPTRSSNYTAGTPTQTEAADFKDTGSEDFAVAAYWTSTATSDYNAQAQFFGNGNQASGGAPKNFNYRVRAIRKVAV